MALSPPPPTPPPREWPSPDPEPARTPKVETELNAICKDILTLLDESLITKAGPAEPAVFYQKMKASCLPSATLTPPVSPHHHPAVSLSPCALLPSPRPTTTATSPSSRRAPPRPSTQTRPRRSAHHRRPHPAPVSAPAPALRAAPAPAPRATPAPLPRRLRTACALCGFPT